MTPVPSPAERRSWSLPRRPALVALLLLTVIGCGDGDDRSAQQAQRSGDTRAQTLVDPDGDGLLQPGPGEPLRARTDLGGGTAPRPGRPVATIVQLTDAHVRDEESPARTTFLDRFGAPFGSTARPHEALSAQVLDAAVRTIGATRPDLVVETGDLTDNAQRNEHRLAERVLRGGRADPDSGGRGYEGVQQAANPDPSYYRPGVDPPQHPDLLTAAQRPFQALGLPPTTTLAQVPGNHDLLLQGEIVPTPQTDAVATGARLLTEPDTTGLDLPRTRESVPQLTRQLLDRGLPGESRTITADPQRAAAAAPARQDRVVDVGARTRVVLLDLTDRDGGGASVKPGQAAFLERALDTGRWVLVATHQPLRNVAGERELRATLRGSDRVLATIAGDAHRSRVRPSPDGYWELETSSLADFPMQTRALQVRETPDGGAVLDTWMLDLAPTQLATTARDLAFLDAQGGRPQRHRGTRLDRNVRLVRPPRRAR